MPGLQSGVLARATFAVVPVTDNNPLDAVLLVITGNSGHGVVLAGQDVLDLVGLAVLGVDGTDQHVVRDVVEMSAVFQPGSSHGDVVSGGLALSLDKDGKVKRILAVPSLEGLEDLQTVRSRRNSDRNSGTVLGRSLEGVLSWVVAVSGQTGTNRLLQHELVAVLVLERIRQGVEVQGTSNCQRNNEIRRGDERVSGRVSVVTASEITVVGRKDRVGFTLLYIATIPLT
jgi:hypothetical protein